ncbi:hypothetical protein [Thiopseudomonas acetoxidans]|uniref:Uncharacterized protein n=1 Tax=Thiopseudomonas acetoxidans TaxID=3041622 RepID=A0ABT7SS56_9GAMM|nr:hypothetical protein [Thiopseudomonas sp. CY1220]MDM7858829.1 hypothetical protein [Thiopseudomonas sp. CY1220]
MFIGQTENDASLIDEAGRILKVDCFLEDIERIVGSRNLIYKPHPYDMRFAKKEYRALKRHTRLSTQIIKGDTYSLLASDLSFETLTISSGTCQEALFFNKKPFYLFKPICNPWDHLHVRLLEFCSPAFWAECLGYKSSKNLITMSYHPDNVMRRFHDVWWGYSDFMINNDQFWLHAYKTSRKNEILRYIDSLKNNLIKLLRP